MLIERSTAARLTANTRTMSVIILLIIKINIWMVHTLTCEEILQIPTNKKLLLSDLQSIQPKDMVECLSQLSKDKITKPEADYIWQSIVKYYDGVTNVPEKVLASLAWVTIAVAPEDYANVTLSDIDVIQNFGKDYNLNGAQLAAIADKVREEFAGKQPEDYTHFDLTALGQILCAFNRSEIERIHPLAYKEAAVVISKLENCNPEVMAGFATLAIQKEAFGRPSTWTKHTLSVVGKVKEYLQADLKNELSALG